MRIKELFQKNSKLYMTNVAVLMTVYMSIMNTQITSDILYSGVIGEMNQRPSIREHLASGRYTNYVISWIYRAFNLIGINKLENQWVLQVLGILLYAVAATILYRMFEKAMKLESYSIFLNVLVWICFVNPFFVETFVYVAFDWAIGILLAVLAAYFITRERYLSGGLLAFLAVSTYQTNIVMTLLFAVTVLFIKNHTDFVKLFFCVIKTGVVCAAAAVLNILIPKLCIALNIIDSAIKETGVQDPWNLRMQWIRDIVNLSIRKAYGMLPNYFLQFVICAVAVVTACVLLYRYGWKKIWIPVIWGVFVICCMAVPYVPCFITSTIGFPQRTLLSLFVAFSMILICGYAFLRETKWLSKAYLCGTVLVAGMMLYSTETGITDVYIANAMDFHEAKQIQEAIVDYEEESGNEITKIAVHRPGFAHYAYAEQHYQNVYTLYAHRLFYDAWADVNLLNYMFGENYERINMDQLYTDTYEEYQAFIKEHWEGKYWDHLDIEEQLIFDGDTLYWSLY